MTPGQRKTVAVLGVWVAYSTLGLVGLLIWEFHSLGLHDRASITETIQFLYAQEQWPFMLLIIVIVGVGAALWGHFFMAPADTYEKDREQEVAEEKRDEQGGISGR